MMDRNLVLKLVGKKNSVILEDSIFYIINILDLIRGKIIKKEELEEADLEKSIEKIKEIRGLVEGVLNDLKKTEVNGYTNSRLYLEKYLKDMINTIENLTIEKKTKKDEELILNINILIDLALKY